MDLTVAIAELIAAIGVIVSVIYLAIQVRAGNLQVRQQATNDMLTLMHSPIEQMISNTELSEIVRTGNTEPDSISEAHWFRYSFWWLLQFDTYEYLYDAYQRGTMDSSQWIGTDASFRNVFEIWPGTRKAWREWSHVYQGTFRDYVDSIVDEGEQVATAAADQSG